MNTTTLIIDTSNYPKFFLKKISGAHSKLNHNPNGSRPSRKRLDPYGRFEPPVVRELCLF